MLENLFKIAGNFTEWPGYPVISASGGSGSDAGEKPAKYRFIMPSGTGGLPTDDMFLVKGRPILKVIIGSGACVLFVIGSICGK